MSLNDSDLSDPKDDKVEILRVNKWVHDHLDFQTDIAILVHDHGMTPDAAFSVMEVKLKEMVAAYPGGIKQLGKDFGFYMVVMEHITSLLVTERLNSIMKGILDKMETRPPEKDVEISKALDDLLGMKK